MRPRAVCALLALSWAGCAPAPAGDAGSSPGALAFSVEEMVRSLDDCAPNTEGCTYARFRYPRFTTSPGPVAPLQRFVDTTMRAALMDDDPAASMEAIAEGLIRDYRDFQQELPDAAAIPWVHDRDLAVLWHDERLLTLQLEEYTYFGGAHPNYATGYWVVDLGTGDRVTLAQLFVAGFEGELTTRAETVFRTAYELAPDESLESAGFWFADDQFALNDNWAIDGDEILFHYDAYEIAAYALGQTEVRLSRESLEPLLRPAGPWTR